MPTVTGSYDDLTVSTNPATGLAFVQAQTESLADSIAAIPAAIQNQASTYCVDTGTANAYAIAPNPPITSYVAGQRFTVHIAHTNTGASTLNVSGLGAVSIRAGTMVTSTAGLLAAGQLVDLIYDGTAFELRVANIAGIAKGNGGGGVISAIVGTDYTRMQTVVSAADVTPSGGGTSNTSSGIMAGLGAAGGWAITPATTGKVLVRFCGQLQNTTGTDGAKVIITYGTGTPPTPGAIVTGTQAGATRVQAACGSGTLFCVETLITGLSIGTAYWLDLVLAAVTGGTATIHNCTYVAQEV